MEQVIIMTVLLSLVTAVIIIREVQYNMLISRLEKKEKQHTCAVELKDRYREKWIEALDTVESLETELRALKKAESEVVEND